MIGWRSPRSRGRTRIAILASTGIRDTILVPYTRGSSGSGSSSSSRRGRCAIGRLEGCFGHGSAGNRSCYSMRYSTREVLA
jgi:hypothetical protein